MNSTKSTTLYKLANNGKTQQWTIERNSDRFRTSEGYLHGAITFTEWTVCESKNVGRTNATTGEQQAVREVLSKIQKQKDNAWIENIEDIKKAKNAVGLKPMLTKDAKDGALIKLLANHTAIALQPKLDGIRAVVADKIYSRNLKVFSSSPHILNRINNVREYLCLPNLVIDGELYNHEYHDDFNKIASLIKTQKPDQYQLIESAEKVQYHIFDIVDANMPFNLRYKLAKEFVSVYNRLYPGKKELRLVETIFLNNATLEDCNKYYDMWMGEGFEGHMARSAHSRYEGDKRSWNLVKRKEMVTDEFQIANIVEGKGNRAGVAARVWLNTKEGYAFKAGIKGNMDYCKKLLKDKDKYIGKMATIQFQNYTPGPQPVPRFTKMLTVRDYE